jgi:hypothetical protein
VDEGLEPGVRAGFEVDEVDQLAGLSVTAGVSGLIMKDYWFR